MARASLPKEGQLESAGMLRKCWQPVPSRQKPWHLPEVLKHPSLSPDCPLTSLSHRVAEAPKTLMVKKYQCSVVQETYRPTPVWLLLAADSPLRPQHHPAKQDLQWSSLLPPYLLHADLLGQKIGSLAVTIYPTPLTETCQVIHPNPDHC